MKTVKTIVLFVALIATTLLQAQEIKPTEVKKVMERVADWQIDHFKDIFSVKKPCLIIR